MKAFLPTLLAASMTLIATIPAHADDLLSGEFQLGVSRNGTAGTFFKRVEGSFATQFDSPFNAQLDLGVSKFEAATSSSPTAGLHITYELNDQVDLGVFLNGEDRLGTSYLIQGAEIAYTADRFGLEAYAAIHKPVLNDPLRGEIYGVDAHYDLNADGTWIGLAGVHMADFGAAGDADTVYLGLRHQLREDVAVQARVAQHDGSDTVLSVQAEFSLGNGVKFNRRDWFSVFPARP